MTDSEPVLVQERRDNVLVLRLNRPEARNALNGALIAAFGAAIVEAETDPGIRAVVVTGTGDRAFCAGMDLRDFAADGPQTSGGDGGLPTFMRFLQGGVSVPLVGAANATAVAGGFEVLLGCDVVVAAESARFGLPEVKRALFPAGGGAMLAARIPMAVALELTLTGDPITAQRAYELGLVNQVVPADRVLDAAVDLALRIARNGPLALEATKELVRMSATDVTGGWARQAEWYERIFSSEDAREGATAFVEKRDPVWKGR